LMPNYVLSQGPGKTVLRNFEGNIYVYTEPGHVREKFNSTKKGIAALMQSGAVSYKKAYEKSAIGD